jgi:hypothetical protein
MPYAWAAADHTRTRRDDPMAQKLDLDLAISRYATARFGDATPLQEVGLESLSLLRLAVEVATDDDAEIDATLLAEVRTVGDLKGWLAHLATAGAA